MPTRRQDDFTLRQETESKVYHMLNQKKKKVFTKTL